MRSDPVIKCPGYLLGVLAGDQVFGRDEVQSIVRFVLLDQPRQGVVVQLSHQHAEILDLGAVIGSVTYDQSLTTELLASLLTLEDVVLSCRAHTWQASDASEVLGEVDSLLEHDHVAGEV